MSLLSNISQVSLASQYPTDKIVKTISGSFNTATSARQADEFGSDVYAKLTVAHGFTRPVFTKLKWSRDNVTWVDGGLGQLQSEPLVECITYSDVTSVVLLSTALSGTVYYQIICFWIDDYDGTNPLVESFGDTSKPLAFDSRLNYQKIYLAGEVTLTAPTGSTTIAHNLGRKPNTWVYFESNRGQVWPVILGGTGDVWLYNYSTQREIEYSINNSTISLALVGGTGSCRVWYRIYVEGS
jgi:hypothetical protein